MVCRELTKGNIDAKATLNIVGDEAIIEVEETVPCGHKHHHHKHKRHHHKIAASEDCNACSGSTAEDTELKEESCAIKKESALAAALALEAEQERQRVAAEAAKPADPILGALASTKELSC